MGKKITQLATITEIADDDLLVGVDISDTSGSAEGTNKKFTKANLLSGLAPLTPQLTGWNPDTETWAYHSVDDPTGYIKIEGKDVSANYSIGWRIMFTNGGNVIKGIITAITFTDPDTIITFLHEIDPTDNQALYLLTNSAITENYFSPHKAPLGFPMSPAKWSVTFLDTTQRDQSTPTQNTWYNLGTLSFSLPIGVWDINWSAQGRYTAATVISISMQLGISTSNNSVSDTNLIMESGLNSTFSDHSYYQSGLVTQTSKTNWYVIGRTRNASVAGIGLVNSITPFLVTATCAYL